ncbi:hypothetical protein HF888_11165 [Bermanella marisrubri]|uniref:Putative Oxidoreductase n=1 Tax=Bermanella marisrubri TaxID=207949 RepID=Q1N1B4_9GAMM|nr:ferredoxin reductase [Bermanella marisrubri]EAT11937.1 putative Oxidoreductase [Oceanobacter sp. RED65] [Bermanella marisrubri]QIZ84743.1 hypothetical protein HF888_11165 [Bermanella marisrubri]
MSTVEIAPKTTRISQWFARSLTTHNSFAAFFEPLIQWIKPNWRADRCYTRVVSVRYESSDMYTLQLKPLQSFSHEFAGQYVELIIQKDGAWVSRYFTISSSPEFFRETGTIELSIAIQANGRITPWLMKNLNKGDMVNLGQPMGDFLPLNIPRDKSVSRKVFIAGGSGITPFRSSLQSLMQSDERDTQEIELFYYARSEEHFLFREELQRCAYLLPKAHVHFMDSEKIGFFDYTHLQVENKHQTDTAFFVCGPPAMIQHVRSTLNTHGVKKENIYYEFFGPEPLEADGQARAVLFQRAKLQANTEGNESLLELAEKQELKPVSGCRIGVCHQCICKKQSGRVRNIKTGEISDSGQQEIQLCISTAVDDVVLDL